MILGDRTRWLPLLVCLAWAIVTPPSATAAALRLVQSDGTLLELERPALRVITLSPHLAELAFDAGAGDRVLATVEYSDFPAAAKRLPRIGDAFRFDLERILALEPDLIIGWDSGNPAAALDRLEALGLAVWRTEIRKPEDIATMLEQVARATGLGTPPAARQARSELARLRDLHAGKTPLTYFYQVSERPLFTLNGEHLVSQGLALCGGLNIFGDEPTLAPQVSREAVLLADPDLLIAPAVADRPDPLEHWRSWPRMTAVRNGAFLLLPADAISRATRRTLDSIAAACRQMDRIRALKQETPNP